MSAEKAAWRARFRALREAMPAEARAEGSRGIVERVRDLPEVEAAGTVHLFWPLPFEVDLRLLAESLRQRGTVVALPVVVGDRALVHRRYLGPNALARGKWGLMQPPPSAPPVDPGSMDVVLVPALAIGRDGSRLGYGGGFYDAFLAQTPALRVGVVFADALADAVPSTSHDARLDVVVTEAETVRVGA